MKTIKKTTTRRSPSEDFERMLGELASVGRNMSESEVESLASEAVAASRRKVRPARKSRKLRSRKR